MRLTLFALILFSFIALSSAQDLEKSIEESTSNLENNVTQIRGLASQDGVNYIKELLLKNEFIASINSFFIKINLFFVILFAHDWSLSFEMLFIFGLWLFVFVSSLFYLDNFLGKNKFFKFIIALSITIVLAHARVFYYISLGLNKLFSYKPSILWKIIIFLIIFGGILVLGMLNKIFAKSLGGKEAKNERLEKRLQRAEKFQEGFIRGSG